MFLQKTDRDFPVPLSAKQNLQKYAHKIIEYATICTIEDEGNIIAAAIGYTGHLPEKMAYLAVVATASNHRGRGLAVKWIKQFITQCQIKEIPAVHVYTAAENIRAIHMYESLGFQKYFPENEPRFYDFYIICYVSRKNSQIYLKYESTAHMEHSVIIQEKLQGQEYGLDVINDLEKKYINTSVKKKIAMRSGETDCAVTVG